MHTRMINGAELVRLLVVRLVAQVPAAIAAARRDAVASPAGPGLAAIPAAWRDALAAGSAAAHLGTAPVALHMLGDADIEQVGHETGVGNCGKAAPSAEAALALARVSDDACGARVDNELAASLLASVAVAVFDTAVWDAEIGGLTKGEARLTQPRIGCREPRLPSSKNPSFGASRSAAPGSISSSPNRGGVHGC